MYFSLIVPYLLIGIIGTCYLLYMYQRSYESRYQEIVKEIENDLEKIDRNLESCISDAERTALEISTNSKFKALKIVGQSSVNQEKYDVAMAVREMSTIKPFNIMIYEAIVYYESRELVITPRSIRDFELLWKDYGLTSDEAEMAKELFTGTYLTGSLVTPGKQGSELYYIKTIFHSKDGADVNVIIRFNMQEMKKRILDAPDDAEEYLIIVSDNKQYPIYADNNQFLQTWRESKAKSGSNSYLQIKRAGENTGLTYYKMVAQARIKGSMRFQVITYLGIGACFILLIWFGYNSVRINYQEIEKLINKLSVLYKQRNDNSLYTEIGYMKNAVTYLEDVIRKQGIVVTEDAIKKAIYGLLAENDEIYTWLLDEKGLFCRGSCILALMEREQQETEEAKRSLFILDSVIKEVFEETEYCGVIVTSLYYIVILNWLDDEGREVEWILKKFEEVLKFSQTYLHDRFTIAVSGSKKSILELDDAYREKLIALSKKQIAGQNQIVYYGNLKERNSLLNYDKNWKEKLLNNLKAGNRKQVENILNQIYQTEYIENNINLEAGKIIFFELDQMLLHLSEETGINISLSIEDIFGNSYTAENYMKQVKEAAQILCQQENSKKIDESGNKVKEIQNWIHSNYTDCNLSVSMLAEQFHLNMTYLSRVYKEQTGENLLNYIMGFRVKKAEELLLMTDDSITVIAEQVGFTNAASFNRAFKKNTGITPGKYREINQR